MKTLSHASLSQILFLSGLGFIIGYERTFWFFFQKHKWKGSGFFFLGILVVFVGWPVVGMCLEVYGFIQLFGSVSYSPDDPIVDYLSLIVPRSPTQRIHSGGCLLPPSCPIHWHDFKPARHLDRHGQDRRGYQPVHGLISCHLFPSLVMGKGGTKAIHKILERQRWDAKHVRTHADDRRKILFPSSSTHYHQHLPLVNRTTLHSIESANGSPHHGHLPDPVDSFDIYFA